MTKIRMALLSSFLALAVTPAMADNKVLNLYSWAGIFDQETLDGYKAATGYTPHYDTFDSDEMLETKLLTGSTGYDLVTPASIPFLQREIRAGALREYDPTKVPNAAKMDPTLIKLLKASDPKASYSVIGAWGTTGLGLNVKKINAVLPNAPLDSLDLVFNPENAKALSKCGFVIVDSATDIVPLALRYLGLDTDSNNEADIKKAMDMLYKIRPYITYIDSTKYQIELSNGAICAAIGWSGDIVRANKSAAEAKNGVEVKYVIPKEGALAWMTTFAIPKDAPNPDAAYAFMNYLLDPKVAAHMSQETGFPTPINEARNYLPPELANDPALFPSEEVKKTLFTGSTPTDKVVRYTNRLWAQYKAAK